MGRHIRMYEQDGFFFVTARATQARLLLRPSADVNEVAGGVLARAVQRYDVEVYGYVFASNHVHLLVHARDGVLSRFMQYFLGNLARKVGRLVDWRGTFWERRFSAEPVLDDSAMEARLKYILAHGVKEGLVRRVEEWPGLSCAAQLLQNVQRTFKWFHWERRWKKGKLKDGGSNLLDDQWAEQVVLEVKPLPHWASLSTAARRHAVVTMIQSIETDGLAAHPTPLGRAAVEAKHPHTRPDDPKRSPRPPCHTAIAELKTTFIETYRSFVIAYREASERFRDGDFLVAFPPRAFRPPGFCVRVTGR